MAPLGRKPLLSAPAVAGHPWRCFEGDAGKPVRNAKARETSDEEAEKSPRLVCAACRREITSASARTRVDGRHEHAFVNPHGFAYHIGCFSTAPGCLVAGEPSREFTWFRGHTWQMAICGGCHVHLGWSFSGAARFFGLILDRLVEADDAPEQ